MDHLLQEQGILHHRFFLGEVNIGHLVEGRTPWIVRLTLSGPFYKLDGWTATLCCNNKRALEKSSNNSSRIRPSAKCVDIRRSLRTTKPLLRGSFRYVHVYRHTDRHLTWDQLTLTQQINCVCDTLAKKSIAPALTLGYHDRMT